MKRKTKRKELGFITQVEMTKPKTKLVYWSMFAILMAISLCMIVPALCILVSGFKDTEEFLKVPPTLVPQSFHPEKIKFVWEKFDYVLYFKNTFVLAVGTILFTIVLNGLAGYVLSRLKPRGSRAVFTAIVLLMMIPGTVSMVPLYMTICDFPYLHLSMLDSYTALWIMAGANCFNILVFKSFFDSLPIAYIEAAQIDGYNNLQIFYKIIIPLSVPVIMTISILTFNASWGDFLFPYLILTDKKMYTVSIFLFRNKSGSYPIDIYMIMLTLSILPPAIIFVFLQKHIIGGMTLGGIKE